MTGPHWSTKRGAARRYRQACGVQLLRAKPRGWAPGPIVIDVEYRCPRDSVGYVAFDAQNAIAAMKQSLDAFADAGIVKSDHHENVRWGQFTLITQAAGMRGKKPGVTIFVRRA